MGCTGEGGVSRLKNILFVNTPFGDAYWPDREKYEIKQNFLFYHEHNLLIDKVTLWWWFTVKLK